MIEHGFIRIAAAVPRLRVADCAFNVEQILALLAHAEREGAAIVVFPELAITGYTCADLFHQTTLQQNALAALIHLMQTSSAVFSGLAVVGLPLAVEDQLFNCAAVIHRGKVLGVVPKSFLPNYKEFYEKRWFASAATAHCRHIRLNADMVPFGTDLLFDSANIDALHVGVEVCEDLWVPIPPSSHQALKGATVLLNLSASNEVTGKAAYRRQLVANQSGRCVAAYAYASCGVFESTTDVVFGGHSIIAENGVILAESRRFQRQDQLLAADVDLDRLRSDRMRMNSFGDAHVYPGAEREFRRIAFTLEGPTLVRPLRRVIDPHPFVPSGKEQLRERCEEIFHTQVSGLARRLEHIGKPPVAIGISGGLDSTLALVVACKTVDILGMSRKQILAYTMPGFGTSARTKTNAQALMQHLGVTAQEVDIRPLCMEEMRVLGHRPFEIDLEELSVKEFTNRLKHVTAEKCNDLVFENIQARMRTSILMNRAFVIGTGDLSEAALGWCTYNGDHMSMYNPNASIPKTLVKFLVGWAADDEFEGETRRTLLDIVATEISPELLPTGADGKQLQATESVIGPYELHDFFMFHFLRYGAPPAKIAFLAENTTFDVAYTSEDIRTWLTVFLKRFFANQFKRSCMPDGPKVGSISLSPRGDWRMPSDAHVRAWLAEQKKTSEVAKTSEV